MATENFFNLTDTSQGIARQLGDGLSTRVFPGEQAMLSLVTIEPNAQGRLHSHPEEQWGVLLEGEGVRTQDGEDVPVKAGASASRGIGRPKLRGSRAGRR